MPEKGGCATQQKWWVRRVRSKRVGRCVVTLPRPWGFGWLAVALVMGSPGKPRTDAPHQGQDASFARGGGLCDSAEMAGQVGTEQEIQ